MTNAVSVKPGSEILKQLFLNIVDSPRTSREGNISKRMHISSIGRMEAKRIKLLLCEKECNQVCLRRLVPLGSPTLQDYGVCRKYSNLSVYLQSVHNNNLSLKTLLFAFDPCSVGEIFSLSSVRKHLPFGIVKDSNWVSSVVSRNATKTGVGPL